MPSVEESFIDGEREIGRARQHWQVLLGPAFLMALGLAAATFLAVRASHFDGARGRVGALAAAFFGGAGVLPFALQWAYRQTTEYVLTNRRLIVARGLLSRTTIEVLLPRITAVDVQQSLVGRVGGFGTLVVEGFAGAQDVLVNIEDPHGFRKLVELQLAAGGPRRLNRLQEQV